MPSAARRRKNAHITTPFPPPVKEELRQRADQELCAIIMIIRRAVMVELERLRREQEWRERFEAARD